MEEIREILEENLNDRLADLKKNAVQPDEKTYSLSSVLPEDKFSEFISVIKTKADFDEVKLKDELTAKLKICGDLDASLSSKEFKEHACKCVNQKEIKWDIFEPMGIDVDFWEIEDEIKSIFVQALVPDEANYHYWKFDELMKGILVDTFGSYMEKEELLEFIRKNNFSSSYSLTFEPLNDIGDLSDVAYEITDPIATANYKDYIQVEFEEDIEIYNKECPADDCDHRGDEFTCEKMDDKIDLNQLKNNEARFCYHYNNGDYFDGDPVIKNIEFLKNESGLSCKVTLCLDRYDFEDSFIYDAFGFDKTGTMNFENCKITIGDYLCAFFSHVHGSCKFVDEC